MTISIDNDYQGIPQAEAAKKLATVKRSIETTIRSIGTKGLEVGRTLNEVLASGLAVAAADEVEGNEREWNVDGRTTAVGDFVKTIEGLTTTRANELQLQALRHDEAIDAGHDMSKVAASAFKYVPADTSTDDFVALLDSMKADEDVSKLTSAAVTKAGREAGIIAPPNAGGGSGDDAFLKAMNAATAALTAAISDGRELSKNDKTVLSAIIDRASAMLKA